MLNQKTRKVSTTLSLPQVRYLATIKVCQYSHTPPGVLPRPFSITGHDHASIVSYVDVLQNKASVGERVAIIGAGGIGFDVAEYLLHDGSQTPEEFCEEWGIDRTLSNRGGIKSVICVLFFLILIFVFFASGLLKSTDKKQPKRKITLLQRKEGKLGAGLGKTTGESLKRLKKKKQFSIRQNK